MDDKYLLGNCYFFYYSRQRRFLPNTSTAKYVRIVDTLSESDWGVSVAKARLRFLSIHYIRICTYTKVSIATREKFSHWNKLSENIRMSLFQYSIYRCTTHYTRIIECLIGFSSKWNQMDAFMSQRLNSKGHSCEIVARMKVMYNIYRYIRIACWNSLHWVCAPLFLLFCSIVK